MCNALVAFEPAATVTCPHCHSKLKVGTTDPTWHDISEIDSDVRGGGFGEFRVKLHPVGTNICVQCQQIFPATFECCPGRVNIAFSAYNKPADNWGPQTQERIRNFLLSHPKVVAHTAKLRILQSHYRERDPDSGMELRQILRELHLRNVLDEIADELE